MLIDTLTSKNYEDFKQRYQNCFGFLELDGKEVLCRITSVAPDKVVFDTEKGQGFWAYCDQDVSFKFFAATRGWFYSPDNTGPVLFMRVPARQYARGVNSNNTNTYQYRLGKLTPTRFGFSEIKALFHKDLPTFNLELHKAQALSKHFAVGGVVNEFKERTLYLYDREVGLVKGDQVTITHEPIRQEFMDLCRRNNLPLKVIE